MKHPLHHVSVSSDRRGHPGRLFRLIALITFYSHLPFSQIANAQWQPSVGVEGKNMQSLFFKSSYTFAGGSTGVYVSTDNGRTFNQSNAGNDTVGPTRGFASSANRMFTCTSQGVFSSSDNGASWVQKSVGLSDLRTSGILYLSPYLLVVTPVGIFRSMNEGDGWESAGLSGKDVRCIASIENEIFVGTNGEGAFKSSDFGNSWQAINTGLQTTTVRAIQSKGSKLFAGGAIGTGIFRSDDLGTNWIQLTDGIPKGSYRGFASNESFIFAGSFGAGVFYSSDNGAHWAALNLGLDDLTIFDLELTDRYLVAATNTKGIFHYPLSSLPGMPFHITNPSVTPNGFKFEFPSSPNAFHVIQYLDALGTQWKDLLTVSGTAGLSTIVDESTPPQTGARFYRVVTP